MGLSNSLFAGISGLTQHQTRLDVIGNNLANVNTYGFKSQRVLFQDILYNTIRSGTAPDAVSGGTNPQQLGSGVDVSQVTTNFNQGDLETTGIDSDLAIEGTGFFVIRDGSNTLFTRDGAFALNQERKLVNASNGMLVQGWNQTRDNAGNSSVNSGGATSDVVIPVGDNRIAKATSQVIMNGNLNNQGDVATTGTILNSQRLFSTKSSDTEIANGAFDLAGVYIKDPAGGSENKLLFKGSGSTATENNVLTDGDQIRIQMKKGGRPLEAIFTYGDSDKFDNVTGLKKPDGIPDAGLEHYDGKTLNDFLTWFDTAFGLKAVENTGASSSTNAANGLDGDNPNDLLDMGLNSGDPFKDETDGQGFSMVLSDVGISNYTVTGSTIGGTANGPKAAIENSTREFNIIAGSGNDIGTDASFVDLDEDGSFNKEKDLVLEGTSSYVVTGNSTVTKGAAAFGSSAQLGIYTVTPIASQGAAINNGTDMFIDVGGDGGDFVAGTDILINNAFSQDVFASTTTVHTNAPATVNGALEVEFLTSHASNTHISSSPQQKVTKGMSLLVGTTRYTVVSTTHDSTTNVLTVRFDKAMTTDTIAANATVTFQGMGLVQAGCTATSATSAGTTLTTNLKVPKANKDNNSKWQGISIHNSVSDNEKGMAGTQFISGDGKFTISDAPLLIDFTNGSTLDNTVALAADATSGLAIATFTGTNISSIKTGMTVVTTLGNKLIVDKVVSGVVTFDKPFTTGDSITDLSQFSGFAFLDVNTDGTNNESVYRVRNSRFDTANASTGTLFIDLDHNGVDATATTDLTIESNSAKDDLSSFSDNEVVLKDTSGNVYRKVPAKYDPENRLVYKDLLNKGTYDEIRFNVINAGTNTTTDARWVIDSDFDGAADATETNVITADAVSSVVGDSLTMNLPSGTSVNGVSAGSSRIQLRGNIGTANEISQISFISGADNTEYQIFASSTLADTAGHGFSQAASADGESVNQNIVVYDSLGKSHDVTITFALEFKDNDKAEWRWYAETADASQANGAFPSTDPRGTAPSINVGTGKVVFDNFGRFMRSEPVNPLISIPLEGLDTDSALQITPDFSIITSFADSTGSEIDVREQDGYPAGVMDRYAVNADGTVTGIYTNGNREVVAQIALAAFANPSGLVRAGNNIFKIGANSGNAMIGAALTGERGAIRSKALEQSNVDITSEFTNMIITQRAYQANARLITKSDELLQELMQIIR